MRITGFQLRLLIILGVLSVVAISQLMAHRRRRRGMQGLFQGRPARSPSQFAKAFFGETPEMAEMAEKTFTILVGNVPMDLASLEPDDDFVADLMIPDIDRLALGEFLMDMEEEFGIKFPDKADRELTTFRQVMDYLGRQLPGGPKP